MIIMDDKQLFCMFGRNWTHLVATLSLGKTLLAYCTATRRTWGSSFSIYVATMASMYFL